MRKKLIVIILIIFAALMVVFFYVNYDTPLYPYDNFKRISTLEKREISLSTMNTLLGTSPSRTMDEMKELGIADVVRYNKGHYYSITPLIDGRYLLVLFEIKKDEIIPGKEVIFSWVMDFYYVSELCDRKTFDETIKIGVPMEEILAMDPDAYFWGRTVDGVTDYHSRHRFNDRSFVSVTYTIDSETQQPVVADFHELSTEDFVLTYLLPWDLELITK